MSDDHTEGIWLEVEDVQFERKGGQSKCRVRLKGDRNEPKKTWWLVEPGAAAGGGSDPIEDYRAILREQDKERLVLARLAASKSEKTCVLQCDAFRFQGRELGSR